AVKPKRRNSPISSARRCFVTPSCSAVPASCPLMAGTSSWEGLVWSREVMIRPSFMKRVFIHARRHCLFSHRLRQDRESLPFQHFADKFAQPGQGLLKQETPLLSRAIVFAHFALHHLCAHAQVPRFLHRMQDGVERPWAEIIAMTLEFGDDRRTIDRLPHG